jgi:hypothetical protein
MNNNNSMASLPPLQKEPPKAKPAQPKAAAAKPKSENPRIQAPAKQSTGAMRFRNEKADETAAAALQKTLGEARKALGERKFARAEELLDLATLEANAADSITAINRTRYVVDLMNQFWDIVRESMKELKATDEIKVGESVAIVVEASENKIVVRSNASNRELTVEKMLPGVARALAERRIDDKDPLARMLIGAFLMVDPAGNVGQGRELLENAALFGVNVTDLQAEVELFPHKEEKAAK